MAGRKPEQPPLTRADLEEIAFAWGVEIEDLWAALEAAPDDDTDDLTA